jgi:hypothetical protein
MKLINKYEYVEGLDSEIIKIKILPELLEIKIKLNN